MKPKAVKPDPKPDPKPTRDELLKLLDDDQDRLVGLMAITQALSRAECDFPEEACGVVSHELDDISASMFEVVSDYRKQRDAKEAEA